MTQTQKQFGIFSLPVIIAALGYFVDIYDLLLFSIIRVPSLKSMGLTSDEAIEVGKRIINIQMMGLLIGGFLWGVMGDKIGRMKVLFASIILYSFGNIANGFVQTPEQYAWIRFISGIGLAGELGASITLVTEILPKNKRGLGTSVVAGIGLSGAVFAFIMKESFENWRICYFIGGGMGFLLLLLRAGILESTMFHTIKSKEISKGNLLMLVNNKRRFTNYIKAILIGIPTWYVIGLLLTFSDKFAHDLGVTEKVDPGKSVMWAYVAIAISDFMGGFVSHYFKSRKKAVWFFYSICIVALVLFFNLPNDSVDTFYFICALLGFGTGFWALFVTMAAEQFGTNIRATVTTTVPNIVRGSLVLTTFIFDSLKHNYSFIKSGWLTGIIIMSVACLALFFTKETFHKDLDFIEE
ncbi:MAG: MFS transporter [Bacteroidetes bacterium]|nr:MFS transporter [Bacteroidota bacterium]